ncbi:MAG: transcription termination/antitermination NusG family protein [Planctomycetota bacterium]|jgi:transcriptional antiterminator NusG
MQWYVLRVAANKEVQVKDALVQKVEREALTDIIGRIEVPVERIKRIRGNKQTVHKRKLYPGYVFMEMESTDDGRVPEKAWFMIKGTSGVGDFIGSEGIPSPMRDTDVAKMLLEAEKPEEAPSIKVVVESIDSERGIIKVIVTIFGRSTPLDIEYWQIEKL